VRDVLLGLEPKDYDVATDAEPQRVRALFRNTQAVGQQFGVILVRLGQSVVEVATFRSDGVYLDGRRPAEVRFTTAQEDAQRRDFTINGLFLDPVADQVIDYVGGREDLKAGVIRAIGEPSARFGEDHLRMLRALRFAARYGFRIEPRTQDAIRQHAPQLIRISPERIAEELRLTLPGPNGAWAWREMLTNYPALADVIFRFLPPPVGADREALGIFNPTGADGRWPFGLCLAAIALEWVMLQTGVRDVRAIVNHEMIRRMVRAVRQSLRISNDESAEMEGALEGAGLLLRDQPRVALAKRFLARPTAALSRKLLNVLGPYFGNDAEAGAALIAELNQQLDTQARTDFAPAPWVTGDDLTAAGLHPGPIFKRVLDAVYDAQLEGLVGSKAEAMELALRLASAAP
jgi:poly(A) polymerase